MAQGMFSSKYFDPLRHRDFALLWSGQAVSQLGDGVFTVTIGWGLSGAGVLGLGLVPNLWLAAGVAFVTYGLDAYGSVLYDPLIQQGVPAELLGRVASVNYVLSFALSPLGLVAAGALAEAIGVRTTLLIGGGITALTTLIPFLPGVKDPTLE